MAGDKPVSQLPENTSPNDNDFFYTSTPGAPRLDKFIRLSTLKELFGFSKIHDQNTDLGTNSPDFTLGFGEDGTITLYLGEEGHAIRVNKESTPQILEWTNNGTDWYSFGTGSGGTDPNAVQKSSFTNLPYASTINFPLNDENLKRETELENNFTYEHGTITSGSTGQHQLNTGDVATAITITWDTSYTYYDMQGNELSATYDLPAGANKIYNIFFEALDTSTILVAIQGVPSEAGVSSYNDLTDRPTINGSTAEGEIGDDILNMPMTGASAILGMTAASDQLKQYVGKLRSLQENHWRSLTGIASHGIALGELFRTTGTTVTKAIATSEANAIIDYVAINIPSTSAIIGQRQGHFNCTGVTDDAGAALVANTTYYLSSTVAGKVTATEPAVSVPVFRTTSATIAVILLNGGGNVPNASTTVAGKVEKATSSEITAGTATGGTGAPLFIGPDSVTQSLGNNSDKLPSEVAVTNALGTEYVAWKLYMTSNYI